MNFPNPKLSLLLPPLPYGFSSSKRQFPAYTTLIGHTEFLLLSDQRPKSIITDTCLWNLSSDFSGHFLRARCVWKRTYTFHKQNFVPIFYFSQAWNGTITHVGGLVECNLGLYVDTRKVCMFVCVCVYDVEFGRLVILLVCVWTGCQISSTYH